MFNCSMRKLTIAALSLGCLSVPAFCAQGEAPVAVSSAAVAPAQAPAPEKPAYVKKDTYFSLNGYDGVNVDLASYAGKPVLVMFFTSYCPYCKFAAPVMQHISETYGPKGLAVLGISTENAPEKARDFAQKYKLSFPIVVGGKPVSVAYKAHGVPNFYLLDSSHDVAGKWLGYDDGDEKTFSAAIEKVLSPAKKS